MLIVNVVVEGCKSETSGVMVAVTSGVDLLICCRGCATGVVPVVAIVVVDAAVVVAVVIGDSLRESSFILLRGEKTSAALATRAGV